MTQEKRQPPAHLLEEAPLTDVLKAYEALIAATIGKGDRKRFKLVAQLSNMANQLVTLDRPRAKDFDIDEGMGEDGELNVAGGGIVMGQHYGRPIRYAGGDQMDLMRTAIDQVMPAVASGAQRNESESRRAKAEELHALLKVKEALDKIAGEDTTDISNQIAALRKDMSDALVRADVLRGHQAGESEGEQGPHSHLLGEPNGNGEEGPRLIGRACRVEEVG